MAVNKPKPSDGKVLDQTKSTAAKPYEAVRREKAGQ